MGINVYVTCFVSGQVRVVRALYNYTAQQVCVLIFISFITVTVRGGNKHTDELKFYKKLPLIQQNTGP